MCRSGAEEALERSFVGEPGMVVEELQLTGAWRHEHRQHLAPEQARQHVDVHEEVGAAGDPSRAIQREPSARHDHVHVRMMGERRAPGVEHGGDADACAETLGVGSDRERGLGRRLHQQVVDDALVLVGDVAQLGSAACRRHESSGTGSSSASRSASHRRAAAPWHFGQCRLRQQL